VDPLRQWLGAWEQGQQGEQSPPAVYVMHFVVDNTLQSMASSASGSLNLYLYI
jgi:hypothetical protein